MTHQKEHIIFDLDGCLSDDSHRLHWIEETATTIKKDADWEKYFSLCLYDKPIMHMIGMFKAMRIAYPDRTLWILTGRCETVKTETEMWLKYYDVPYDVLVMRPKDTSISTVEWKEQILKTEITPDDNHLALFAFDDNRRIIDMWRKHGIMSFHMTERYY